MVIHLVEQGLRYRSFKFGAWALIFVVLLRQESLPRCLRVWALCNHQCSGSRHGGILCFIHPPQACAFPPTHISGLQPESLWRVSRPTSCHLLPPGQIEGYLERKVDNLSLKPSSLMLFSHGVLAKYCLTHSTNSSRECTLPGTLLSSSPAPVHTQVGFPPS